jgi:hypothetical protein
MSQAERNGKIPSFKYIMRDSGTAKPVVDTGKIENKMMSKVSNCLTETPLSLKSLPRERHN